MKQIKLSLSKATTNETSINEVALRYGVTHMGRLSENYKLLFSEKQHETLLL